MKTSRYDSQRADGTNKWDDCPWLKVCPSEATRGADGSRPPTSAAIGGRDPGTRATTAGGEFPQTGSRVSANGLDPRDSRTAERPALTIRPSVTDGPPAVVPSTGTSWTGPYLSRPVAPFNAAGRTLFGPTRVPHDGLRIPPARSCPPLCLKVLCEPVDSCFSLKLLNGFYTKPVLWN